ncbi:MAG TPA: [protein-PII] uridylyltransferase [Polyangiales bacterium]|nr:[protein-PII] uridylyltransferase [Polyangiales bacterium]
METCSDYLVSHTAALKEAVRGGQRGLDVAARYAQMFDGLLGSLCCAAQAFQLKNKALGRVALVAVGGYGRRLVAPHSDVDVVFLADHPSDERIARLAEGVLYPLWDAGVQIGHAVRGVEETLDLSKSDIRTSTTLLDTRHIAGDKSLVQELVERARGEIFEAELDAFIAALETDTISRHERYGGTLFLREPELKLGRGGLRDLDVVTWIARARWGVDRIEDLVPLGFLSQHELMDLAAAQEHLWMVRNRLHVLTRRRHDRLTFEDQESVASLLGYRDGIRLAVEQFMQTHYRRARTVARLMDRMPERARRSRRKPPLTIRDVGRGVLVHDSQVTLRPDALAGDPALALRFYNAVVEENLPPDPEIRDAIAAHTARRDFCQVLRRDPEATERFCELLVHAGNPPLRRGSVLEELHEVGLLVALIPEFEQVMGRVPYDAYHAYTADVHALLSVDRLRAMARGELAADFPVISRCAAELPRPLPLYAAALLFELGAGHPDDPAKYAAAVAGPVCERLGLGPADVRHVQWLIVNKDRLYRWALRRDISDPDTIADIAREVQTIDRLRDLYLLTFASASTANPTAMTAWNSRMLAELWFNVSDLIEGRRGASDYLESLREQAANDIDEPVERAAIEQVLNEMPERYLLANSGGDIAGHYRLAQGRGAESAVQINESLSVGSLEILVVTDDRPGLLADLAAALSLHRYEIASAQLYTRKRPGQRDEAFDIFHVTHPGRTLDSDPSEEIALLQKTIGDLVSGRLSADTLLSRRSKLPNWARTGPRIKTEIGVDNKASNQYTVVDVYTRDRPELLYAIADTLHRHGLSIALAKVNTEGRRVADVFYVSAADGGKLAKGQLARLSEALRETIHKLDV